MSWQFTPYAMSLLIAGAISTLVAVVTLLQRETPGSRPLAYFMLAVAEWSFAGGLEAAAVQVPAKVFWSQVEYIGTFSAPVFFVMFAVEYARQGRWLTRRNRVLLWSIPILTMGIAVTNDWHHMLWTGFTPIPASNLIVYEHGPWFAVEVAYVYVLLVVATFLLVQVALRSHDVYRLQAVALLAGVPLPWFANIVYVFNLAPLRGIDLTPIAFALTGIVLTLGIYQLHMFDLVPIARNTLIESMSDGVLVIDAQNRVVDINWAAEALLNTAEGASIGQSADEVLAEIPGLAARCRKAKNAEFEIGLGGEPACYLDVRVSALPDRRGRLSGRLVVMRDITERKQTEGSLREANARLHAQLREIEELHAQLREQAIRDSLTGLFNRRYLVETLERELARAAREGRPLGVVMMDADHFKSINDTFGHKAGDLMLQALGQLLRAQTRQMDVACRHGGEEFIVILPGSTLAAARQRAELWRQAVESLRVPYDDSRLLSTTISVGVAMYPEHGVTGDDLGRAADRALYAAKAAGRNCVRVFGETE